jgi:histidine triad (HIT) family protein
MAGEDCVFCQIAAGRAPSHAVVEDEGAIAFMDIFPVAAGHTLVIPKAHAENVFEIDDGSMRAVAGMVRRVARGIRGEFAPDGLAVYQANGQAAGQTVWHYHVHLIPRSHGQGLQFHGRGRADDEQLRAMAEALSARIEAGDEV